MGLVFDSNVFIRTERDNKSIDFSLWQEDYGEVFISVVTVSELLVGVHRANTSNSRSMLSKLKNICLDRFQKQ